MRRIILSTTLFLSACIGCASSSHDAGAKTTAVGDMIDPAALVFLDGGTLGAIREPVLADDVYRPAF